MNYSIVIRQILLIVSGDVLDGAVKEFGIKLENVCFCVSNVDKEEKVVRICKADKFEDSGTKEMGLKSIFAKLSEVFRGNGVKSKSTDVSNVEQTEVMPKVTAEEILQNINEGFVSLVDQLNGVNANLRSQLEHHEKVTESLDVVPKVLGSFPEFASDQKEVMNSALTQMRACNEQGRKISQTLEKLPEESARQTEVIRQIREQIELARESSDRMRDDLGRFSEAIESLNTVAMNQGESISQMSKTFASSERYFKYMFEKQTKRFAWVFGIALGVCVIALISLGVFAVMMVNRGAAG